MWSDAETYKNKCSNSIMLQVLSLAPGMRTVIANGRMLGTLKTNEKFVQEDFGLLEKYVQSTFGEKITEVLDAEGKLLNCLLIYLSITNTATFSHYPKL